MDARDGTDDGPDDGPGRRVPRWGLVPAAVAPVALVGGWTLAATRHPGGFDASTETISALAAHGAPDRWIMTTALAALGLCHLGTALALRPAAPAGRLVLAAGGLATLGVAAVPLPAGGAEAGSPGHTATAALAFGALAVWPAAAVLRRRAASSSSRESVAAPRPAAARPVVARPVVARPAVGLGAAAVLLGLVGWFTVELAADGPRVGRAERVAAGAQAVWPLVAVLGSLRPRRSGPK